VQDWRTHYGELLDGIAGAVRDVPDLDLTAELITHRFTPGSKEVLMGWYPRTKLEMDEESRTRRHGKFGAVKYVYPAGLMAELRSWFHTEIAERLPAGRILYWT
jgi:spore photoproduct lyase